MTVWQRSPGRSPELILAIFVDAHLFANALNPTVFINTDLLVLDTLPMAYLDSYQALERAIHLANAQDVSIFIDVSQLTRFASVDWNHYGQRNRAQVFSR